MKMSKIFYTNLLQFHFNLEQLMGNYYVIRKQ